MFWSTMSFKPFHNSCRCAIFDITVLTHTEDKLKDRWIIELDMENGHNSTSVSALEPGNILLDKLGNRIYTKKISCEKMS